MRNGTLAPGAWAGLEPLREDIERSLRYNCRDGNELDDLVQETFLRAARFRRGLQDPRRLRSWVLRIAWNVLRDHIRVRRRLRAVDVGEEFLLEVEGREVPPGEHARQPLVVGRRYVERSDLAELLAEVMPGLREDERALLEAYYGEERGCSGAGEGFGIGPEQVKMRLFRLRNRLRRQLKHQTALRQSVASCREVLA